MKYYVIELRKSPRDTEPSVSISCQYRSLKVARKQAQRANKVAQKFKAVYAIYYRYVVVPM